MSIRRRWTRPLACLALLVVSACTGADDAGTGDAGAGSEGASSSTAGVAQNLLNARTSPGAGMDPSVPTAGVASGQSLSLDVLGYNDGPEDAPVKVVEFSDFGCGYCRKFHVESYPVLDQEYMQAGKVAWKYVPMVLGIFPNAMEAARAGECAGEQGRFPVMRDLLFERQREWKTSDDPEPLLEGFARELGLDVERYRQCVREGWQDERIEAGTQLSRQVGVRGTPTFFVVGYQPIPGAIPLDLFRQVLDTVYVEATGSGAPGVQ